MYISNGFVYGKQSAETIEVTDVKPLDDMIMLITFSNGETRLFDASILKGEVYKPLQDAAIFKSAYIEYGVVTWGNGAIDCAPEYMYKNSFEYAENLAWVTFEHITFGYYEGTPVIQDFSAQIEPGQKIAIVGPTGAGKTTLVNLLMRFYDIDDGSIRLDDVDIRELSHEQVHNCFSMVLQNTWLFKGTLRENLVFNTSDITDKELDDVIKAVGLDYFVGTLSNGYDTILDSSANLSQGQCQQIAVARAMLEKRPMLILDEATSSTDTRTEIIIQSAMDKLMEGRTSFVIAHRLSTIQNADCILVLKDGNIVESGTHEELLKKNGFYAELYLSQFEQQVS